ncbi:MAG: penicillin acylase family protein [Deltaproteobacteria bacterium]|nr:penicillin acylase family protein [Deltaproteobacteria bacterium]
MLWILSLFILDETRVMKVLKIVLAVLVALILAAAGGGYYLHRRPVPPLEGAFQVPGLTAPVEVILDRWGVPHIHAQSEKDAYFAMGYMLARDRLFQLTLIKFITQGRLAELVGEEALPLDRLHRTVDFHGQGRVQFLHAVPEVRTAVAAYIQGVNAWVETMPSGVPVEFLILGISPQPFLEDDFLGLIGFMTWSLNLGWWEDVMYERVVAKVGLEKALDLYPLVFGGQPSIYAGTRPSVPSLLTGAAEAATRLGLDAPLTASNNWVVSPARSASGKALLANDPHLGHSVPGFWYQVHLVAPGLDVAGMALPGFPMVVIGRNRDIAWGFTNVMLDASDYFLERLKPDDPNQVMYKGNWVPVKERKEILRIKGGGSETLIVRTTPHGPLVSGVMEPLSKLPEAQAADKTQALSLQWVPWVDTTHNDMDGFYTLNRARNWTEFRSALSRLGSVAMNVAYADNQGHIGIQVSGRIPLLPEGQSGMRFRKGWDGADEWRGFLPFEQNPFLFDPPRGFAVSANNPSLTPEARKLYISAYWEPTGRFERITQRLAAMDKASAEDLMNLQMDITWPMAADWALDIRKAFAAGGPRIESPTLAPALKLLEGWDGSFEEDSVPAALFSAYYKHLFHQLFADEMGEDLAKDFRTRNNTSALMMHHVMAQPHSPWYDRVNTPAPEKRADVIRAAFLEGLKELSERLGATPSEWRWGRLHTMEFVHPLGMVKALAPYFNLGPFPLGGHTETVAKGEFHDETYQVYLGPGLRLVVDWATPGQHWGVVTNGQSGIRASYYYDNLTPLWLEGGLPLVELEPRAGNRAGRLALQPR